MISFGVILIAQNFLRAPGGFPNCFKTNLLKLDALENPNSAEIVFAVSGVCISRERAACAMRSFKSAAAVRPV